MNTLRTHEILAGAAASRHLIYHILSIISYLSSGELCVFVASRRRNKRLGNPPSILAFVSLPIVLFQRQSSMRLQQDPSGFWRQEKWVDSLAAKSIIREHSHISAYRQFVCAFMQVCGSVLGWADRFQDSVRLQYHTGEAESPPASFFEAVWKEWH
jgi:hypothetical protein